MTTKIVIVEAIDGKYRDQPPFVHHIKTNFLLHPNVLKPVDLQVSEYDRGPYSWWLEWIIQQTIYNYNTCSMLCINSRFNISLTIILKTERGKAVRKRTYKHCYWDCTLYLMLSYKQSGHKPPSNIKQVINSRPGINSCYSPKKYITLSLCLSLGYIFSNVLTISKLSCCRIRDGK